MTPFSAFLARAALTAAAFLAPAVAGAQAPSAGAPRHFLWEVSSVTNRVYLFGTVHAGKADWYPLPAAIEQAFVESAVLVVEADVTDIEAMARTAPSMALTPPDRLANHVSPEDYERFRKLLPRYGVAEEQAARMKPFMAVSLLVFGEWGRMGYQAQYGLDAYLIRRARAELKPVVEIEGIESQVKLMDSMTDAEARELFSGTLKAVESGLTSEQVEGMVGAWRDGDPQKLLQVARKYNDTIPGAKEFEEKFIWSRHADMLKKIEGYLEGSRERHFIAVGALHLAGERGLVELLRKRGYLVKQK